MSAKSMQWPGTVRTAPGTPNPRGGDVPVVELRGCAPSQHVRCLMELVQNASKMNVDVVLAQTPHFLLFPHLPASHLKPFVSTIIVV